jgi:hypothetical protein
MNDRLVNSLVQIISSLTDEERRSLEEQLLWNFSQPTTKELIYLIQKSRTFDFLDNEPDLYTLEDGEPV